VGKTVESHRIALESDPIHIHIEAEITKGKYHNYDSFLDEKQQRTSYSTSNRDATARQQD